MPHYLLAFASDKVSLFVNSRRGNFTQIRINLRDRFKWCQLFCSRGDVISRCVDHLSIGAALKSYSHAQGFVQA